MIFTYSVEGVPVLREVALPLQRGDFVLVTGVENRAFTLLGGVLAGLFPVDVGGAPPRMEELMKDLSGELVIRKGALYSPSVYLGPDPEKHLLFSRVDEELTARTGRRPGDRQAVEGTLELFGLGKRFLKRRISTLSGGEKMKLALAAAFSGRYECLVLHGVLPWLDGAGREVLRREIVRAGRRGAAVVALEQWVEELISISSRTLFFDGSGVVPYDKRRRASAESRVRKLSRGISKALSSARGREEVAGFEGVRFRYESREETDFHLDDVSFSLWSGRMYGLMGENGSGKSTIARLLLRAERAARGSVRFLGKDIGGYTRKELIERICYVGQFPEQQIILSSAEEYRECASRDGNALALRLLDSRFREGKPHPLAVLSPLELKLLLLTSSVGAGTRLLILDEPTWGIDVEGQAAILETLRAIVSEIGGTAVLAVSHDASFLKRLGAELLILENGRLRCLPGNGAA